VKCAPMYDSASYVADRLRYRFYGSVSRLASLLYLMATREGVRNEIALVQRTATMKAHTARKRAERYERKRT
jgi:hypothetical protein